MSIFEIMKTVLLVIDMQNLFSEMVSPSTLSNIISLISHFLETNRAIIFTQHGHSDEELSTRPFRNQLVQKWGPNGSIHMETEDWKFIPAIEKFVQATSAQVVDHHGKFHMEDGSAAVIPKSTYDAFLGTRLEEVLRVKNVERVVVCWVMTDSCCDTTARAAFNRGFETWLIGDACGSVNATQHRAGLKAFGFAFGDVVSTTEAVGRINNDGRDGERKEEFMKWGKTKRNAS